MSEHGIGIVGYGKIAQDQHLPSIAEVPGLRLAAVASQRGAGPDGVRVYRDYREMLASPEVESVAICTPPLVRHAIAREALGAGKHVLLEKPPAATLSELEDLRRAGEEAGRVVFTTWHSQYNRAVDEARDRLRGETVRRLAVTWKEDVRRWHPGQAWIWQAGGFGVFDPGINGLSILTKILPAPLFVREATLEFPENADAPIAATLTFALDGAEEAGAEFDWRQTGPQSWDIAIETGSGRRLALSNGGGRLEVDGALAAEEPSAEYRGIYRRYAELLERGEPEIHDAPFRLVADAFMIGRRVTVEPFEE